MKFVRTAILAGVASAALAGAALAAHDAHARGKMMLVALPDGSVRHIRYESDVAPQVVFVRAPADADLFETAFGPGSPFAEMERMSAAMDAQGQAMMRQAAMMGARMPAATPGKDIVMTNAAGQPVGVMQYSYVSSRTSADGCTQTVSYSSDGGTADQPRVIRTSARSCGTAKAGAQASPVTPTSAPAPKPEPVFTPSST